MKEFNKLPENGCVSCIENLKIALLPNNAMVPSMGKDSYILIHRAKYKWVTDDDGNRFQIQNGYKGVYVNYSDSDWINERGNFNIICDGDWRQIDINYKGVVYNYYFHKSNTFDHYWRLGIKFLLGEPQNQVYLESDKIIGFDERYNFWTNRYHRINFKKFPFLEQMGGGYYRIVPHREALTQKYAIKGSLLWRSANRYKTTDQKVNLLCATIGGYLHHTLTNSILKKEIKAACRDIEFGFSKRKIATGYD